VERRPFPAEKGPLSTSVAGKFAFLFEPKEERGKREDDRIASNLLFLKLEWGVRLHIHCGGDDLERQSFGRKGEKATRFFLRFE